MYNTKHYKTIDRFFEKLKKEFHPYQENVVCGYAQQ